MKLKKRVGERKGREGYKNSLFEKERKQGTYGITIEMVIRELKNNTDF